MEQQKLGESSPEPKSEVRPALRVISEEGELQGTCPTCLDLADQLNGAGREIRSWRARYASLQRETTADENHDLFPAALRLFNFWRERCNHPNSDFTPERFKDCMPHLRDLGEETCRSAIEGAAYDCYKTIRKNGTVQRHDGWSLIFRSREKVEDFVNRAPHHLPPPEKVKTLAQALAFVWGWEPERAVHEAQVRLRA